MLINILELELKFWSSKWMWNYSYVCWDETTSNRYHIYSSNSYACFCIDTSHMKEYNKHNTLHNNDYKMDTACYKRFACVRAVRMSSISGCLIYVCLQSIPFSVYSMQTVQVQRSITYTLSSYNKNTHIWTLPITRVWD